MSVFRWPVVTLLLSYCLGLLACRWLILQDFALDRATIAAMVAVPLVQAAALAGWRRLFSGRAPR
jgi:hypothetical protein